MNDDALALSHGHVCPLKSMKDSLTNQILAVWYSLVNLSVCVYALDTIPLIVAYAPHSESFAARLHVSWQKIARAL